MATALSFPLGQAGKTSKDSMPHQALLPFSGCFYAGQVPIYCACYKTWKDFKTSIMFREVYIKLKPPSFHHSEERKKKSEL